MVSHCPLLNKTFTVNVFSIIIMLAVRECKQRAAMSASGRSTKRREAEHMVQIRNRHIFVDGEPQLIMSGEIHYFRLSRHEWEDRIAKLKAAGCNAVASYIPWLCHEPFEGELDLEGRTRPELNLPAFMDLCRESGLYFIARPGPFVMAELKNEGLPYWVYERHPEIVPLTWDGKTIPTRTVDYLAPGFQAEVRKWYSAVMPVIASRLHSRGGNVIAVQLDNEIGMLSWMSDSPDLTEHILADFTHWLQTSYDREVLETRYPFDLDDPVARASRLRSPREDYAVLVMHDLGRYMRYRFARYVAILRSWAESFGITGVPFIVNVHGTEGGRATTYPVGISQLYESYTQSAGYIAGSDIYLGDLTMRNFQDLYLINGLMSAVNRPEQPLTSLEFECGDGNYDMTYSGRSDPSSADFKLRMCVAQGAKLVNFYLFAGGRNYRLDRRAYDGNDRISFTGERHGFAAPVSPEGELNYTYPRLASAIRTMMAVANKLAVMDEEHDDVAFGFIPDYYMTECSYPGSRAAGELARNLDANRGRWAWDTMGKAMLLACYRFGAVDIQNRTLDPDSTPALVLASARYMDHAVQHKIVSYLQSGGRLLLYGEVPSLDMEGHTCTILADALGVRGLENRYASDRFYLSVCAVAWVAPRPEVRVQRAQALKLERGEPILRIYHTDDVCGFEVNVGEGKAVVVATDYPCDVSFFRATLQRLGVFPAFGHDCPHHGIFLTSCASPDGGRFLHLLNLDGFDKDVHFSENGLALFGGRTIPLRARDGIMLPMNLDLGPATILYSTAEVKEVTETEITFQSMRKDDVIELRSDLGLVSSEQFDVAHEEGVYTITSAKRANADGDLKGSEWSLRFHPI
jgi:beta-galactosidase